MCTILRWRPRGQVVIIQTIVRLVITERWEKENENDQTLMVKRRCIVSLKMIQKTFDDGFVSEGEKRNPSLIQLSASPLS